MTSPDYYLLDELLTDEARAVRDRVRAFVGSDLLPVINEYWERAEFPDRTGAAAGRAGHHRHHHPGLRLPGHEPQSRRHGGP